MFHCSYCFNAVAMMRLDVEHCGKDAGAERADHRGGASVSFFLLEGCSFEDG